MLAGNFEKKESFFPNITYDLQSPYPFSYQYLKGLLVYQLTLIRIINLQACVYIVFVLGGFYFSQKVTMPALLMAFVVNIILSFMISSFLNALYGQETNIHRSQNSKTSFCRTNDITRTSVCIEKQTNKLS